MATLIIWTPLTLFAVVLGYWIVAAGLLLAPLLAPVVREAWQARRDCREPQFVRFRTYPTYLLRFRRAILFFLCGPPVLLALAWCWARMP